jgi:hypothetical protein
MVTRIDYSEDIVRAARSVMIELGHLLGEYRKYLVIIGGWVPELLFPGHVGSMDVDIAIDHRHLPAEGYKTILELLSGRGYRLKSDSQFTYIKDVLVGDRAIAVQVDLLAGEYAGTVEARRHQRVQDVLARKVRGCDIAFDAPMEITIEGELPGGAEDSVRVQVASINSFLVMKGVALANRMREKDAYDIYYCIRNYPGGLDALVAELRHHLKHGLVKEGFERIAEAFSSEKHTGPKWVADFEGLSNTEDRELLQRDVYERVSYVLKELGIR